MQPRKIQTGEPEERIVAGKDNLFGADRSLRGPQDRSVHGLHPRLFVDRQRLRNGAQKLQRMKLCLPGKAHRAGGWQRCFWIL